MRVLILSCSTGGGHNAAGYAMKEHLEVHLCFLPRREHLGQTEEG